MGWAEIVTIMILVAIALGVIWALVMSIMRRRADRQFRLEFLRGTLTNEDIILRADRLSGAEDNYVGDEVTSFFFIFFWLTSLLFGGRRHSFYLILRPTEILIYDNTAGHDGENFKSIITIPRNEIKGIWFRGKREIRISLEGFITLDSLKMNDMTFRVFKYTRNCGGLEKARRFLETNYPR